MSGRPMEGYVFIDPPPPDERIDLRDLAFASECLDRMKPGPARAHVETLISAQLSKVAQASAGFARPARPADAPRNWEEVG